MNELIIWYGELITRKNLFKRGLLFLMPGMAWLFFFLVLPCLILFLISFAGRGTYGNLVWEFSLDNYARILGYGIFGWTPDYVYILIRSIWVALVTTFLCVLLSYPLCFYIARKPPRTRYLWLTIVIIPFWTNLVIRTYAWFLVLAPDFPPARIAAFLNLIPPGMPLYPSAFAVYLGMISVFLPFVALPLFSSIERLDWTLLEAAQDLYASHFRIFIHAILPQTLPGLSVGIILTLVPAMGMFVVPDLLGGAKYMLIGNLIQQQFGASRDYAFGAAISMALMMLTMFSLYLYRRRNKRMDIL